MDKLIVVIIGIALSAATVLWSVDYLSATYTGAGATVRAQKWITEAAQIAAAARQAGTLSVSGDNWQQGTSTTPTFAALSRYLSGLPQHNGMYVFAPCNVQSGNTVCPIYVTDSTHATDATIVEATVENGNVCQAIQKIASRGSTTLPTATVTGTNPITITTTVASNTLLVNTTPQFTCINASGTYYFLYRVFLSNGS